ncbi:hypothetical protein D3C76_1436900 [compost metagenome]
MLLECAALWAVADHNQLDPSLWIILLCSLQALLEHAEVLFRRQPSDMQQSDIIIFQPPLFS